MVQRSQNQQKRFLKQMDVSRPSYNQTSACSYDWAKAQILGALKALEAQEKCFTSVSSSSEQLCTPHPMPHLFLAKGQESTMPYLAAKYGATCNRQSPGPNFGSRVESCKLEIPIQLGPFPDNSDGLRCQRYRRASPNFGWDMLGQSFRPPKSSHPKPSS